MVQKKSIEFKNKPKVFIWQGQWQGGAENITLGIARTFRDKFGIDVTLGVYKGYTNPKVDFKQIETVPLISKKVIGYLSILASLYLKFSGKLENFNIIFTHGGGFWKTKKNYFVYHEAVNLIRKLKELSLFSKIYYYIPIKANIKSTRNANLLVAATKETVRYTQEIKLKHVLKSSSFFDEKIYKRIIDKSPTTKSFNGIFIGRPRDKIKNFDNLMKAIKPLENVSLTSTYNYLPQKNITYLNWVEPHTIFELFKTMRFLILPSFSEGFSLVLLEALACGLPVITTRQACPDELIDYVQLCKTDSQSIRKSIKKLKKEYSIIKNDTVNNAKRIREKYNSELVLANECSAILDNWNQYEKRNN